MTNDHDFMFDEPEQDDPDRDERGRFRKGASGNPNGRPRKLTSEPWSLQASMTAALAELVPVTGSDGCVEHQAIRDVIVRSLVRNAVKAKAKDQLMILERLEKLDALAPLAETDADEDELYTEEDRRLLELINRDLDEHFYCQCERCDRPIRKGGSNQNW